MSMDLSQISLRPFLLSDAHDLFSWAGDDQVTKNIKWNTFTSKEDALSHIRDKCIPHPWCRSICFNDRSIGFVAVNPGSGDDKCRTNIGYALSRLYWGKGIATLAMKLAVPMVFRDFPDLVRIQGLVDVENIVSQRVLEKVGFAKEGVLRKYCYIKGNLLDMVVFSFLSSDEIPV